MATSRTESEGRRVNVAVILQNRIQRHERIGRVPFARAAGRWPSGATSPMAWRWGAVGEVSHLGCLGYSQHMQMEHCYWGDQNLSGSSSATGKTQSCRMKTVELDNAIFSQRNNTIETFHVFL